MRLISEADAQRYDHWRDGEADRQARLQRFRNCRNCAWAQVMPALPPTATDPAEPEFFLCPHCLPPNGDELDELLASDGWHCEHWEAKGED